MPPNIRWHIRTFTYTMCQKVKARVLIQQCMIGSEGIVVRPSTIYVISLRMAFIFFFFWFHLNVLFLSQRFFNALQMTQNVCSSILYLDLHMKTSVMTRWKLNYFLHYLCYFYFHVQYIRPTFSQCHRITNIEAYNQPKRHDFMTMSWTSGLIPVMMWTVVCSGWRARLTLCACVCESFTLCTQKHRWTSQMYAIMCALQWFIY